MCTRRLIGWRRSRALRRGLLACGAGFALVGGGAPTATAAGFVTANGCPHHQAFVEGDDAAVSDRLPAGYAPVRTPTGAPLLFVRAIRCEELGVDGQAGPGIIATFGVVIESPDGLGCASAAPIVGMLNGENPPICNWYLFGWLSDDRRLIKWLHEGTPGVPAAYAAGLEFELGEPDSSQSGVPFHFATPASVPSPFTIDAVGREHDGELRVRGGYWLDTPDGTLKFVLSTNDLTSGSATGVVTAAPGSLLAILMGATERSYVPGYSEFSAERWQRASYRKQNLAPAEGADSFDGSCSFHGVVRFTPPATNAASRDVMYDWDGEGTCTGTLNGEEVSDAPAKAHQAGPAHATCNEAVTITPGQGAIRFASGEEIRSTVEFSSVATEVDLTYYGERSGFSRGHATFLTDRTSPDVLERCESEEGVTETPLDVTMTTESPLVSEPPREAPRLKARVAPQHVRRGERRAFRFRVRSSDGGPVKRALIEFAGHREQTGRYGKARIVTALHRTGRHRARIGKQGFERVRVSVRARPA
jgi:hypothetical protein